MPADLDPNTQTEEIGFPSEELISCERCGRPNGPNRLECIYCGASLNVRPEAVDRISIRKLESWEPGTSIVITDGKEVDLKKAADLLSIESEQLDRIVTAGLPLPVAWVHDHAAEVLQKKLADLGYACTAISDAVLLPTKPLIRVASMRFEGDELALIDLNTREEYRHRWDAVCLVVPGIISTGTIESMEKRRLRKTTVISDTTTSADEPVLDVYTRDSTTGYRVQLAGFDYSCLGDRMSSLASENIHRLVEVLGEQAPGLKVVDDYKRIRHLLTGIWDIDLRKDPKGLQQVGFGKREFGVVHSTNNAEQFTRFSRLQRLML